MLSSVQPEFNTHQQENTGTYNHNIKESNPKHYFKNHEQTNSNKLKDSTASKDHATGGGKWKEWFFMHKIGRNWRREKVYRRSEEMERKQNESTLAVASPPKSRRRGSERRSRRRLSLREKGARARKWGLGLERPRSYFSFFFGNY